MKDRTKTALWVGGSVVVIGLLLVLGHFTKSTQIKTINNPNNIPSIVTSTLPWGSNSTGLRARLKAIGLSALSNEGTALHIHTHIAISINGEKVIIPAGVGINRIAGFIATIHTHRANGIIHIESPTIQKFTLGQFFDTWGVRFTSECIGGYCTTATSSMATATSTLKVYADGKLYTGNPRLLPLKEREDIYIIYGTATTSDALPAKYVFPTND